MPDRSHTENTAAKETRERVLLFFLIMTSEACQRLLHDLAPAEEINYKLCRLWFDEIYKPGLSYLDNSLKGDYSKQAVREFEEAFEVEELIELERFHRFFELRLEMQINQKPGVFPNNESWQNLVSHAKKILEMLEPQAHSLQHGIAEKISTSLSEVTSERALLHDLFEQKISLTE